MRLGFYTPNYPGITHEGGIGSYTRDLSRTLVALNHEVHILTPGAGSVVREAGVTVHQTSTKHLAIADRILPGAGACWRVGKALKQLVNEHRLEVVEFPNWEGLGLWFQMTSRVPTVVRLHTSSRETQAIDGVPITRRLRWDVKRERWQSLKAAVLVTHSDAHRRMMAEELGCPSEQIELIPHGVHVDRHFVRPARLEGPPTVVYLGRLEKRKGTIDLLNAIPLVLSKHPDARFVLIGQDRAHCPGNRTHAQFLHDEFPPRVREQITLAGRLPNEQVDRWLQTADVFVAPSHYESFGLIFPEAMRWGTPVIGTKAGGIPEIVKDGVTGFLVEPQRPTELADAINQLLADPALRRRIGEAGRHEVENFFSIERAAQRVIELFERVVAKNTTSTRRESCPSPS